MEYIQIFFLVFALLFVSLFIFFAILRPIVKARFNVFYCGFCYSTVTLWVFLLILWFFNVFIPPFELLAILLGMSIMGIWQELKKRNISHFGIFTILWILFSIFLFYSIETMSKTGVLVAVTVLLIFDAYLLTRAQNPVQESTNNGAKSALDNCCD